MERQLPDSASIEHRLRERYVELWMDVGRELHKRDERQREELVRGVGDAEDDATADFVIDLNLSEINRDIEELHAVQHAIWRLRQGEYGICETCGSAIDAARLEALPQATLCAECQDRAEAPQAHSPSL